MALNASAGEALAMQFAGTGTAVGPGVAGVGVTVGVRVGVGVTLELKVAVGVGVGERYGVMQESGTVLTAAGAGVAGSRAARLERAR